MKKGGFFRPTLIRLFLRVSRLRIRSSAGREPKGLVEAPVKAVTTVGVVSGAGHVIELTDAGHHGARVLLLHGLA